MAIQTLMATTLLHHLRIQQEPRPSVGTEPTVTAKTTVEHAHIMVGWLAGYNGDL
jgi:hypothetical protein